MGHIWTIRIIMLGSWWHFDISLFTILIEARPREVKHLFHPCRYSDFLVNEVDKFGHVVHLTSLQQISAAKPKRVASDVTAVVASASGSEAAEGAVLDKGEGRHTYYCI